MLELIERTLLNGGDLEQARQTLLNQANIDRQNRNNQIEHDFRIATLVMECLLTEPKGSCGYSCAKGIMNRLQQQYRDKENEKVIRKLFKDVREEERKEHCSNDQVNREEEQTCSTGTEQAII